MTSPTQGEHAQTEALDLADDLESFAQTLPAYGFNPKPLKDAADELRRLAALVEAQQPAPSAAEACPTCNDQGAVGNIITAEPCPDCTPQADSQPAPALDERDDFEKVFPLPSGCIRCGTGYASTGYSNWAAHTHVERWQGWQARAARAPADSVTAPAGGVTAEPGWKSEDFEVTHYPPMPTTGLLVGMPKGVKVTHRPTGLFAVSEDERSQHRNREVAWNRLQEILAAQPTPPAQAADSVLEDAARYRALRDEANQLHEDDISVSDSSFTTYFGSDLDEAVDALVERAARKQGANHD